MSFGEYSFLPWLRRGIANQLQLPASSSSRAALSVTVRVHSDTAALDVPAKSVLLIGPGDIIGINAQMVIRTEPRHGVESFEPNYLAYADFYDEDFAWRYTPDVPDLAKHRLIPWITLLVLKEGEFKPLKRRPLPAIELTTVNLAEVLPPDDQLWAWAHVHLNASIGNDGAPNRDGVTTLLRQNPDLGYCRLMSPRRLEPSKRYHAFVIPTFEVGRLAALGDDVPDSTPGLKRAWATSRTFPAYYQWEFSTGTAGDFEDLVTALVPRDVNERVGIRLMDVQQPGFQLPPPTGQPGNVVGLEGALLAPTTAHVPVHADSDLPANLAASVNLPADEQTTGVPDDEEPLISIPLYGRWHAMVDRAQAFPEHRNWINELNTDPRFRAVAGMGTKVIQENQESYMKLAWEQIGDVLGMNRKIAFLQVSVKASAALYAKSLVPLSTEHALAVTAPVMRKVMGSPVTVHTLVQGSRLPRAALSGAMRKQLRTRGQLARRAFAPRGTVPGERVQPLAAMIAGLNAGTLTAAAPRPAPDGATYESTLRSVVAQRPAWLRWIAVNRLLLLVIVLLLLGVVAIAAAALPVTLLALMVAAASVAASVRLASLARSIATIDALQPEALTPESIAALPPNDAFVLPPAGAATPATSPAGGPDSPQGAAFREAALRFHTLLSDQPPPLVEREPLVLASIHTTMLQALRPGPAFSARHSRTLSVGRESFASYIARYHDAVAEPSDPRIVPVMAYPDIKLPMYRPLKELQKDNFVPNLHLVPPDTISLMLTNPPVIESYMAGLNHELARELLWREYPTDQRPSTFRQFWDASHFVPTEPLSAEALEEKKRDIKRIHEWPLESPLGAHNNRLPPKDARPRVVLLIRGELLKRYPNTIIYAQKARWGSAPGHENHLLLYDESGEKAHADIADPNFRFPMFRAQVEPDIDFIGFDLLLDDARGDPGLEESAAARAGIKPDRLGWFFVLQEPVGEPRFGLDEHAVAASADNKKKSKWNNLSWANLGPSIKVINVDDTTHPFVSQPPGTGDGGAKWGSHAADMAFILYQKPVLVAIHARDMLKKLNPPA
jgi:hypothetical protein